jgi:hypothetical protein
MNPLTCHSASRGARVELCTYERNVVVAFLTVRHLESIGFPPAAKGGWLLWVGDVQLVEGCGKLCWQRVTYVLRTNNVRGGCEAKLKQSKVSTDRGF